jgi:hypothetical protein
MIKFKKNNPRKGARGVQGEGPKHPGGGYPILNSRQLPVKPSTPGIYDIIQDFKAGIQGGYELGVSPPRLLGRRI